MVLAAGLTSVPGYPGSGSVLIGVMVGSTIWWVGGTEVTKRAVGR